MNTQRKSYRKIEISTTVTHKKTSLFKFEIKMSLWLSLQARNTTFYYRKEQKCIFYIIRYQTSRLGLQKVMEEDYHPLWTKYGTLLLVLRNGSPTFSICRQF